MQVISVRERPEYAGQAIEYISSKWGGEVNRCIYEDCITRSLTAAGPLPQWYLLEEEGALLGCAGLIPNDFISCADLWPWLCALYVEEAHRGKSLAKLLMDKAKADARGAGFSHLYLCTDHVGYYEKQGFSFLGMGYQLGGERIRVYECAL